MARPTGFEPVTDRLEGDCSIRLSYGRTASLNLRAAMIALASVSVNFTAGGACRVNMPKLAPFSATQINQTAWRHN